MSAQRLRLGSAGRGLIIAGGLLLLWQAVVTLTGVAAYILPPPLRVLEAVATRWQVLLPHAGVTAAEILIGLLLGGLLGVMSALLLAAAPRLRSWLLPVMVVSQAIPVFALAPILTLWLGYGMASKIVMAALIIYFPVTAAFYDGLRRTEQAWLDMARTMDATPWRSFRHVRVPAALPALASGLRVACAVAPIGAVVGEWVGSSAGLGYLMLQSNARMQTEMMFAALLILAIMAVGLYLGVDALLRRLLFWQPERD